MQTIKLDSTHQIIQEIDKANKQGFCLARSDMYKGTRVEDGYVRVAMTWMTYAIIEVKESVLQNVKSCRVDIGGSFEHVVDGVVFSV